MSALILFELCLFICGFFKVSPAEASWLVSPAAVVAASLALAPVKVTLCGASWLGSSATSVVANPALAPVLIHVSYRFTNILCCRVLDRLEPWVLCLYLPHEVQELKP